MSHVDNPRAVVGDNRSPDYAKRVTDEMAASYAELVKSAEAMLAEARLLPKEINSENEVGPFAKMVVRMRDCAARALAFHKAEKEPYLRGGEAVDQFFFGLYGKLARRYKSDAAGAADILQARIDAFMQRKLAEERRQREEAERHAREEARKAEEIRRKAEQERIEAEQAAIRARKQENIDAHLEKAASADLKEKLAASAAQAAALNHIDSVRETVAKPADMVRQRTEGGEMVTMRQVPDVYIIDETKLDHAALWPFVKSDHKLMALKAWAKITQHKQQMEGAHIGMRDETVVR